MRLYPNVYGRAPAGAWLSEDGVYRYALWRRWDIATVGRGRSAQALLFSEEQRSTHETQPPLVVDMLNPSTADAERNDQTITRLMSYAEALGAGGIIVVNLYGFRATNPDELYARHKVGVDIVGPRNREAVALAYELACARGYVLAAWGATETPMKALRVDDHAKSAANYGLEFRTLLASPTGDPCHPLVRRKVHPVPQPWSPR